MFQIVQRQRQIQLASGLREQGALAALPRGLATMQDIAEGLQLSQQFNTTSQMLMREIVAMRDTLAVFNAGMSLTLIELTSWQDVS